MIRVSKLFITFLLVSFLLAMILGGTLPYYIFFCAFSVFIIGFIYILIQYLFVDAEVMLRERVFDAGDTAECLTIVKCSTVFAVPYVQVEGQSIMDSINEHAGELVNLTKDENYWIRSNIKFYQRGIYDFGSLSLKVFDIFRAFRLNKKVDCNIKVKVFPRIYDIGRLTSSGKDIYKETLDKTSMNEDMFTIRDVRKYQEGDSLKKIHWKVSAKHGELFVKNSNNISGEEFTIFLDLNKENLAMDAKGELEESMVDLCVSLAAYILGKGIGIKTYINAQRSACIETSSKEQLDSFMEYLITQKSDGDMELGEFLYKNSYRLQRNNRIAVIAGRATNKLCTNIGKLRGNGYAVTLFYTDLESDAKNYIPSLKNLGVECIPVKSMLMAVEDKLNYERN